MAIYNPTLDNTVVVTLRRDGVLYPVANTSTVRGRWYTPDGITALTSWVTSNSADPLGDWAAGEVALAFDDAETANMTGLTALLLVEVVTSGNARLEWRVTFSLDIPANQSVLFPDRQAATADIQALLAGMGYTLTDTQVWSALKAAEADAQHKLRVFLRPTYVLPSPVPVTDLAAVPEGTPWVEEPGYDYEPDLFQGEGWGYLVTRHRPILSVDYIQFAYPQPLNTVWNLPMEWVRLDKKYGHIRIVPAGTSYSAPFSAWMMQVLGGGRNIPQMIRVRYRAGLENAALQYPDLLDAVKKMAILRSVESFMPGTSESISADGLSQSKSLDLNQYRDAIKSKLDAVSESIHGVKLMVL